MDRLVLSNHQWVKMTADCFYETAPNFLVAFLFGPGCPVVPLFVEKSGSEFLAKMAAVLSSFYFQYVTLCLL